MSHTTHLYMRGRKSHVNVLAITDLYILLVTALAGAVAGALVTLGMRRRGVGRLAAVVRNHVGELVRLSSSFSDFILGNSIHIPYIYQKAVDMHGVSELREATSTPLEEIRTLYLQLTERIKNMSLQPSYTDFIQLCGEFTVMVHTYHRVCVIRPARWIFPLVSEKGSTPLLSEFMMVREKYQKWVSDFSAFLKNVNDSLGQPRFPSVFDHIPIP